jgi:hypothetical protein
MKNKNWSEFMLTYIGKFIQFPFVYLIPSINIILATFLNMFIYSSITTLIVIAFQKSEISVKSEE